LDRIFGKRLISDLGERLIIIECIFEL